MGKREAKRLGESADPSDRQAGPVGFPCGCRFPRDRWYSKKELVDPVPIPNGQGFEGVWSQKIARVLFLKGSTLNGTG